MKTEKFKAENADEIVWLRLNRLKSTTLCEKLIRKKLEKVPNARFTEDTIRSKSIGLSSAIESALGYWNSAPLSLNAKILSRYYFLLQLTIAEQVSNTNNTDDLKLIQRHTEYGHGLATITDLASSIPEGLYVYPLSSGHFFAYAKAIGLDMKEYAMEKREKVFSKVKDASKLTSLTNLFRRIPELSKVVEEYLEQPPLAFHVGYSLTNNSGHLEASRRDMMGESTLQQGAEQTTFVSIYPTSPLVTLDYLRSIPLPFSEIKFSEDNSTSQHYLVGKLSHPVGNNWHQQLRTYSSPYATTTYAMPLWTKYYDSIVTNYALLYTLSIIVRYLPDLWYRITTGDLNHIGSLVEYYIAIMDHVIPLQMLERITESAISIQSPGSFFGEI